MALIQMAARKHQGQRPALGGAPGFTPPVSPQAMQAAQSQQLQQIASIRAAVEPHVEKLESLFGHKLLAYFLEDGYMLADEQMLHLYEHLRRLGKQKRIGLWLYSRGGASEIPWKMVALLREFCDYLVVLVAYRAQSAATVIALGADEIVMTEMAELGPIDPSRWHPLLPQAELQPGGKKGAIPVSVQDLRHLLKFVERETQGSLTPDAAAKIYTALFENVHPLAIGALEQSWALAQQVAERVLSTHAQPADPEKVKQLVEKLSDFYKSHLYQIGRREAKELGLNVVDSTAAQADAIWSLYLAYAGIQIQGQALAAGQQADVRRAGHIDSTVGNSLGLALFKKGAPDESLGAQWQSAWATSPQVVSTTGSSGAPAPPPTP